MSRALLTALAAAVALSACGQPPKPAELITFEQLRVGETAQTVQTRQPELYAEANAAYKKALEAYEDDEPEDILHYTRLADITWRTAVARSQLDDRQTALKAAQKAQQAAEDAFQSAVARKTAAEEGIARQLRLIEMRKRLAEAEAQSRQVKRATDAKNKVDAAAQKLQEAEAMDAARHAPGEFNKAQMGMKMALDQFTAKSFEQAAATADLVLADAQAAVDAARPAFEVEQKLRTMEQRQRAILDAASAIPGVDGRMEARGAVLTLRDLFAAGKTSIDLERIGAVHAAARIGRDFPEFKLIVEGHTDNRGRKKRNLELSRERAEAVAGQLQANGVDGTRITSIGRGDDEPVADNASRDGRALNRRVDIVFIRPTKAELSR